MTLSPKDGYECGVAAHLCMVRLALLHTGALHSSTLNYACRSVRALQHRARAWTADVITIAVFWSTDPQLENDGDGSCTVTFDYSFERPTPRQGPRPGESPVAHHQRLAWGSLAYAVDVALAHHADWIFRARLDVHVAEWRVPTQWNTTCVYGFQNAWGWPSDNALLFPASAARHIFNASRKPPHGEPAVIDGARESGLRFCWVRVQVWLLKPVQKVLGTNNGSTGVRRWTSPPLLQTGDAQRAEGYNHTEHARRRRALHAAWASYAAAPLPPCIRNGIQV